MVLHSRRRFLTTSAGGLAVAACGPSVAIPDGKPSMFLYSVQDYGCGWRAGPRETPVTVENAYGFGCNLATLAAKGSGTVRMGIVMHTGNWDYHPVAYENLTREVLARTPVREMTHEPVDLEHADLERLNLLYMTGHESFELSTADQDALRRYIARGGILLAEDCNGYRWTSGFDRSFQSLVAIMYDTTLTPLDPGHELFATADRLRGDDYANTAEGIGTQWGAGVPVRFVPV